MAPSSVALRSDETPIGTSSCARWSGLMALKDFGSCESARGKIPAFQVSAELELLLKEYFAVSEIGPPGDVC